MRTIDPGQWPSITDNFCCEGNIPVSPCQPVCPPVFIWLSFISNPKFKFLLILLDFRLLDPLYDFDLFTHDDLAYYPTQELDHIYICVYIKLPVLVFRLFFVRIAISSGIYNETKQVKFLGEFSCILLPVRTCAEQLSISTRKSYL